MFLLTPFSQNGQKRKNYVDFYNIIDDFFNDSHFPKVYQDTFKMDVRETEKEYLIEADLPGFKREDIKLEFNEGNLLITASKEDQTNENNNYIRRERRISSMQRGIYLKDVKGEEILAKLEDGILKIFVPKIENPNNRIQIEIK